MSQSLAMNAPRRQGAPSDVPSESKRRTSDSRAIEQKVALKRINDQYAKPSTGRERPPAAARVGAPREFSAADSHVHNRRYMEEFNDALAAMGMISDSERFDSGATTPSIAPVDCGTPQLSNVWAEAVGDGWRAGPQDPAGRLYDVSDRLLICCSLFQDELVVGSADHAAYVIDTTHR